MSEPRWLLAAEIIALHEESIAAFGGETGLRDPRLLESALDRPRNLLAYTPDADLCDLAASLSFGLANNHPFLDGNKRIALLAIAVFLSLNGLRFEPDEVDEVHTILVLASGALSEEALAEWIRANIREP